MHKTTQIILNLIVGLIALVFFMILLFPLDAMIGHSLAELEEQTRGKQNLKVEVASIEASLLFDTVFEEFRLYQDGKEVFYAPKVSAGISLMPLISGAVHAGFKAEYTRGAITGKIKLSSDSVVDVEINKVALKDMTYVTRLLEEKNIPRLAGVVSGSVYFSWSQDLSNKEGEVNLKIANAVLSPYFIEPLNMELPEIELSQNDGAVELDIGLDKGQINIEKFNIPGPDILVDVSGNSRLNNRNQIVRMNFGGKFSISEKLNKLLPLDAMLQGQKVADGSYPVSISGNLSKPVIKIGEMDLSQMLKFDTE